MAYYISVYTTKSVRGIITFTRYNAIFGVVFNKHGISLYGKRDDVIKKMIHEVKKYKFEKVD